MVRATAVLLALLTPMAALPAAAQSSPQQLELVQRFDHQVTGVAVTEDGRIFVNFPRWTEDAPISVAELRDGQLVPYPNADWNAWRNPLKGKMSANDHWICVQSVFADHKGHLWVLDPAAPAMGAVVKNGPKLVRINLRTNTPDRVIQFDEAVTPPGSYLNDVRISPDGKTAYITDSGAKGAIIVVDIESASARRLLDGHPSTQQDPNSQITVDGGQPVRHPDGRPLGAAADGIALSADGSRLYWQALKGSTLYGIDTGKLTGTLASLSSAVSSRLATQTLQDSVEPIGRNGPADGLLISKQTGLMYIASMGSDAIKMRDPGDKNGNLSTLVQDRRLRWPDSMAEGPGGYLYVTASHIQDSALVKGDAPPVQPTALWRIKLPAPAARR